MAASSLSGAQQNGQQSSSKETGSALDAVKAGLPNGLSDTQFADTNWASPGLSEYNFYSDTATSGTVSMLQAIVRTTLQDDVFHEDKTTADLERWVASLFGHEAGLLVTSGTMGNQLAMRAHLSMVPPPYSVVADERAHVFSAEAGGLATLSQAMSYGARPASNGRYLTLEDVQDKVVPDDGNVHLCPTRLICLENTIDGAVAPLAECRRIADWARSQPQPQAQQAQRSGGGIAIHLDGARVWEAVSAQVARGEHGGDLVAGLKAYGACFDSVQACFSKGLGAPIGSILVGSEALIRKARHHRKAIGGGMRATGILAAPARVAVEETFLAGKLAATHVLAKRAGDLWEQKGGRLLQPVETNMLWLDLPASGVDKESWLAAAKEEGIKAGPSRLVFHYQLSEDAMQRLERAMVKTLGQGKT